MADWPSSLSKMARLRGWLRQSTLRSSARRKLNNGKAMPTFEDDLNQMRAEFERFNFVVEDAKRHFGQWDMCDPVVWAILHIVEAQSDFAHAIDQVVIYGVDERVVAQAIAERLAAIAALQQAIEEEPRGPFPEVGAS